MLPKRHFLTVRLTPKEIKQLTKASKSSEYRTTSALSTAIIRAFLERFTKAL